MAKNQIGEKKIARRERIKSSHSKYGYSPMIGSGIFVDKLFIVAVQCLRGVNSR